MPELDTTYIDRTVRRHGREADAVMPILLDIQEHYRYLPGPALQRVSELTTITPATIEGIATFYAQFRRRPAGRHMIRVCHGTSCHVNGSVQLESALRRHLHIAEGDDTDADGLFTLERVGCVGCCTLAPVAQIDTALYGPVAAQGLHNVLRDFLAEQASPEAPPRRLPLLNGRRAGAVRLCTDSCCVARGSGRVHQSLTSAIEATGIRADVQRVGCVVQCDQTPMLEIAVRGRAPVRYGNVEPRAVKDILLRHFRPPGVARRVRTTASRLLDQLYSDESWIPVTRYAIDRRDPAIRDFMGDQQHIAMEHWGRLDPTDLDAYVEHDGFRALRRCGAGIDPAGVIELIEGSGLRGRGGGGFPTGAKWSRVRGADGDRKFVVANGDEGDPGAFMDRMLMESFPFRVIEGIAIAAFAVGAAEALIYVRAEYPAAVQRLEEALAICTQRGILDGSDADRPPLKLSIRRGGGAFICGEETALIASLEGRRGTPRLRPPYPAERGLWDMPTLVNNIETFAVVPWILRRGAEAFAALGTDSSKGTKVFSLAGKVKRGGLIEVPMGITIRRIVEGIGGGVPDGRRFKAVLIGGPSGGCVPEALADTPIDYDALRKVGAIMGSGGLVVLDDADCIVDVARYFLSFTQIESCGQCTFCRIGTRRMLDILERLCAGRARLGDIDELEQLAGMVTGASICGLGRTAPNPILSSLRYFRSEYEAHAQGRCPAGHCAALVTYRVTDGCTGCTLCAQHCPADAIPMTPYQVHAIDTDRCTRCDICRQVCPHDAVAVE